MPQVVMAASCCALLLRMSLVTMQGASGLAKDTYKFVAVSLTLASVCTGMAQVTQVWQHHCGYRTCCMRRNSSAVHICMSTGASGTLSAHMSAVHCELLHSWLQPPWSCVWQ